MKTEEWRDIAGYEGLYQVSNMGRVRGVERTIIGGRGGARVLPEQVMNPKINQSGYRELTIRRDRVKKSVVVHRLVCAAFNGPAEGRQVNHINLDKLDNRAANLEWVTSMENTLHAIASGRYHAATNANLRRKLDPEKVADIRAAIARRERHKDIAARHAVSPCMVSRIATGRAWLLPNEPKPRFKTRSPSNASYPV